MNLPPEIIAFIQQPVMVNSLCLPQNYPTVADFEQFQAGYRYNAVTGESTVGTGPGDFQPGWYVIASNYFDDPFYVDLTEGAVHFPVYFSQHGAGRWTPVACAPSLPNFTALLNQIQAVEPSKARVLALLEASFDLANPLWEEVYAAYAEAEE
jgi:hypothetical protein